MSTPSANQMNTTVMITLTAEQHSELYDALYFRASTLQSNVPGSSRSVAMNEIAACLIDQLGYPVPSWMGDQESNYDSEV